VSAPATSPPPPDRPRLDPVDAGGLDAAAALELLATGEIGIEGRLVEASNATLYCTLGAGAGAGVAAVTPAGTAGAAQAGAGSARCVYKPVRGERGLWDFPDGTLAARELAAYEISEQFGDGLVPPTVLRDGPLGLGMAQVWIDVDVTVDVVALVRSDDGRLRRIALFDAVINNSDRKGGHLLPGPSGRVYAIDHGVAFHADDKLRTVLWNWRGRPFDATERATLDELRAALDGPLGSRLEPLLTQTEIAALVRRVDRLRAHGCFPQPSDDWPAIPWPPF
jgi:uncharacterized repeat protein (TIGR03843 family)